MAGFDPDAFLAGGPAVAAPPKQSGFDPDAFLASKPATGFNPDEFLAGSSAIPTYPTQVVGPPSPTPATDQAAQDLSPMGEFKFMQQNIPEQATRFVQGIGVPSSIKEAKDFLLRSPVQDAEDIIAAAKEVPGKLANFGQTLATSPAAAVAKDPLSPEAFGVYGTAAGLLLPAVERGLRGEPSGGVQRPEPSGSALGVEPGTAPATVPPEAAARSPESQTVPSSPEGSGAVPQEQGTPEMARVQEQPAPATVEPDVTTTPEEVTTDASSQPSAEGMDGGEQGSPVDAGPPHGQQGEAPLPRSQGDVGASPAEPAPQEAVGISKAAIAEQRGARELPDIERQKQIDFGSANEQANQIVAKDPLAPTRLVDELAGKPRALNPEETPLLIRRVQETQAEFDRANKAVNEATTPEARTVAQDRLNTARAEYDKATEITQNATSKTGAGLNSLKMLLNEDYSLAKMESRRRAANVGTMSEKQIRETADLHKRIADLEQKIQNVERLQATRQTFSKTLKEGVAEARQAGRAKRSLVDFLAEKEAKARERIIARRGRLNTGFDPTAVTDEIIIGASHIAKGLEHFGAWSERMVADFGERIKPMLKEIWAQAKAYHNAAAKALRSPDEVKAERYKTILANRQIGLQAQLERGDFTKPTRAQRIEDRATFQMKANLQKLKNQFEKAVATEAYKNGTPAQKFWDHFVGVERNVMKLSGPEVFGKLGVAALVREGLAPIESGVGYGVSKMFPKLARGTKYEAGLGAVAKAEIKAKVAMFTKGIAEAAENFKGKETELEAMGDKHGRRPEFWYHRIGKFHAMIKAPVKRAEFERSLAQRMDSAIRNGEDVSQPQVMARLGNEAVLDANRAIFQQNTVVSKVFSSIEKASPAAGRVARFLFPVVKIPTNIFKEFVGLHVGAPVAATRIGMAYWKGVETLAPLQREAIIRQLVKGSVGGAGLLWAYYNHDKVQAFFKAVPTWFQHTPMAMVMNEGSYLWDLQHGTRTEVKEATSELKYMAKSGIPFMYTVSDAVDALNAHDSTALLKWVNNMTQSTVVPQLSTQVAKNMDKPGTFPASMANRPTYRVARNPVEAVKLGIPGLRTTVPEHSLHSRSSRKTGATVAGAPRSRGKHSAVPH